MPWTAEEDNRFYLLWPTSPKKKLFALQADPKLPWNLALKKNLNETLRLHAHDQLKILFYLFFFYRFLDIPPNPIGLPNRLDDIPDFPH